MCIESGLRVNVVYGVSMCVHTCKCRGTNEKTQVGHSEPGKHREHLENWHRITTYVLYWSYTYVRGMKWTFYGSTSLRDGSAVELVGLSYSAVTWLSQLFKQGQYPYQGVSLPSNDMHSKQPLSPHHFIVERDAIKPDSSLVQCLCTSHATLVIRSLTNQY